MSSRVSFAIAVMILLVAAGLRLVDLMTLPPGFQQNEITDLRISEAVRQGRIEVFFDINDIAGLRGREGLYQTVLAAVTTLIGKGTLGYRMLSVWLGMLTLALVYAVAIRLYGSVAAVAAMGLLAVGMLPIVLSRHVGRETVIPLLVTAVLLALIITLPVYQRRFRAGNTPPFLALGVLAGFGLYLHPVGLLVALMSVIFIGYMVVSRQPMSRRRLSYISFAILLMIILATPYLISSLRRPDLAGASRIFGSFDGVQQGVFSSMVNGLAGIVFIGDKNPSHNLPGRPLIDLVSGLMVIVGLVTAVRYRQQPRFVLPIIALVILSPVALLAGGSPNFFAYAGILPVVALLFGLGVCTLAIGLRGRARLIGGMALAALVAFNLFWTIRDLFSVWPELPAMQTAYNSRLGELAHDLDLNSPSIPSVLCVRNLNQIAPSTDLSDGQIITQFLMNRPNAPIRYADCGTGLVFIDGGSREQIIMPEEDTVQQAHAYIAAWFARGQFSTDPTVPSDSVLVLNVPESLANTVGRFTTTATAGYAPEAPGGKNVIAPPIAFGGNLTFLGYEKQEPARYKPGDIVTLITYWRVDGMLPPDLRLFTHILVDPASIIAQTDTLNRGATQLQDRDVFVQVTYVPLPKAMPDGDYFISIGAYQNSSGDRLFVLDNGQPRGDRLFLYPITVAQQDG